MMGKVSVVRDKSIEVKKAEPMLILVCFFLWMFCLGSALAVVYSTYESRLAIQGLEELRREAIGLKISAGQYQLERSALASYPRVETIAVEQLSMGSPNRSDTVLVVRE